MIKRPSVDSELKEKEDKLSELTNKLLMIQI